MEKIKCSICLNEFDDEDYEADCDELCLNCQIEEWEAENKAMRREYYSDLL